MPSDTSLAWAPSCRSRSIRRSSPAWVSTVSAREVASCRTRARSRACSVGPSSSADHPGVEVRQPRTAVTYQSRKHTGPSGTKANDCAALFSRKTSPSGVRNTCGGVSQIDQRVEQVDDTRR